MQTGPQKSQSGDAKRPAEGLKTIRGIRGLTQRALGALANIPSSTIASYEVGRVGLSAERLRRLAAVLKVPGEALVPTPQFSAKHGRPVEHQPHWAVLFLQQVLGLLSDDEVTGLLNRAIGGKEFGLISLLAAEIDSRQERARAATDAPV